MTRPYSCVLSLLLLLPLGGCLLEEEPPVIDPSKPVSCGNGTCEVTKEDCGNCAEDCACCAVVNAGGLALGRTAESFPEAEGAPDGTLLALDAQSDLKLSTGGIWFDKPPAGPNEGPRPDLTLHGTVTSSSVIVTGCPDDAVGGTGGFEVLVSDITGPWKLVGVWTAGAKSFDLACGGSIRSVRRIWLRGQPGAQGQLDAITPVAGACLTLQGTP